MKHEDESRDGGMHDGIMDDDAVGDAVLGYLNDNPELVRELAPARDLWPGIESRIATRVLPLEAPTPRASELGKRHVGSWPTLHNGPQWKSWLPLAAAAAVLIAGSAGVTYVLTRHDDMMPQTQTSQSVDSGPETRATSAQSAPQVQNSVTHANDRTRGTTSEHVPPSAPISSSSRLASHDLRDDDADPRATYDAEITTLRSALNARRSQLDPATVSTIEQNLRIIDNAIAQARSALVKDPRSRFLGSQLDHSLARETEFLRTAALLPSA